MENKIEILRKETVLGEEVFIYGTKENPLFVASDVAKWIGITNYRDMVTPLDDDEKGVGIIDTPGGPQQKLTVTEFGLYEILMLSRKPRAKEFKKGIKEILRELRLTGAVNIESISKKRLAQMVIESEEEKEKLLEENRQLRPKAELMDIVIDMEECLDVGQVAKALELPYGRNTLFAKLREMGIFFRNRNEPKQKYIEAGYFKLKEHVIPRNEHPEFVVLKVLVTQKGLYWLSKKLGVVAVQQKLIQIQ